MQRLWFNEDQMIWVGLTVSVLTHTMVLLCSGKTFIQTAHYSVQSSIQTVEVSIQDIKYSNPAPQKPLYIPVSLQGNLLAAPYPDPNKNRGSKQALRPNSGVMVKANPDYFQNPAPEYPEFAKQMHQEGMVILSVDVDKEGNPVSVEIIQSSGFRMLDQAALKALRHWKFQPGRIGDIPVESAVTIPIRFKLEK